MIHKYTSLGAAACLATGLLLQSNLALADDFQPAGKGTFIVDLRATDVSPDASDAIVTSTGAATGLHINVSDSVMPTLGFTYFLTNQLAVEAILGTTEHTIYAEGGGASVKVHRTWVLPPVVTLQYRPWPKARLSPYVGAGVNAMFFYGGDNANGFKVRLKDNVGAAIQGGADWALKGPWALNFDVKKVFVENDAVINDGALRSDVHLDPWVISLGLGRRF